MHTPHTPHIHTCKHARTHTHHTHMQAQQAVAASKAAARKLKRAQRLVQDEEEVKVLMERTRVLVSESKFEAKQFKAKELEVLVRHFGLKPIPNERTNK